MLEIGSSILNLKPIILPKSSKIAVLLNQWWNFDILWDFEWPKPVQHSLLYDCKHPLKPFGLVGNVMKWDEHSRVLALFIQKIQTKGDRVIHTFFSMQPDFFVGPIFYFAVRNHSWYLVLLGALSIFHKFRSLKEKKIFPCNSWVKIFLHSKYHRTHTILMYFLDFRIIGVKL